MELPVAYSAPSPRTSFFCRDMVVSDTLLLCLHVGILYIPFPHHICNTQDTQQSASRCPVAHPEMIWKGKHDSQKGLSAP